MKCMFCGNETSNPKFCSKSHAVRYHNKHRVISKETKNKISISLKKYYKENPKKIKRGKEHSISVGKATKGKYKRNPKSILDLSSRTVQKILKRLHEDNKLSGCSNCGWNDTICDIHHINGRKIKNADKHSNLSYLCPNCHRMVHYNLIDKNELITLDKFLSGDWLNYYYG